MTFKTIDGVAKIALLAIIAALSGRLAATGLRSQFADDDLDAMVTGRRPLVVVGGQTQQLATTDYLTSVGGMATNATVPTGAGDIETTTIGMADASAPAAPTSGLALFARLQAPSNSVPSYVNEVGNFDDLQSSLGGRNWFAFVPLADFATPSVIGTADTATGTRTARSITSTSLGTSMKRLEYLSGAGAGSVAGTRNGLAWLWRGNASNLGGFKVRFRFEIGDAVIVNGRTFVGVSSATSAPTDVEPSTLTNSIGMCNGSADTNFAICAAGSVAQAETTLGANFPANTTETDVYELVLYAAPDASTVTYQVTRLNVPAQAPATGTISAAAQLPSTTTFLTTQIWRSNSGEASAVAIDLIGYYGETTY